MTFQHDINARVLLDSVSPDGVRITTMEWTFNRFILAEVNTHRDLSRNSGSSRAIPFLTMLGRILEYPALPTVWASEQKGMSGGDEIRDVDLAVETWLCARDDAVTHAQALADLGVHKSIVNRLLEPFMWHTAVITSTKWDNLFDQRCHPDAQPEFQAVAFAARDALAASTPADLGWFDWHTPLVGGAFNEDDIQLRPIDRLKISAARCARTSYLTHDGQRDIEADLRLYNETLAKFGHWSPLEHVAVPVPRGFFAGNPHQGNYNRPWHQMRHFVSEERGGDATLDYILEAAA